MWFQFALLETQMPDQHNPAVRQCLGRFIRPTPGPLPGQPAALVSTTSLVCIPGCSFSSAITELFTEVCVPKRRGFCVFVFRSD